MHAKRKFHSPNRHQSIKSQKSQLIEIQKKNVNLSRSTLLLACTNPDQHQLGGKFKVII